MLLGRYTFGGPFLHLLAPAFPVTGVSSLEILVVDTPNPESHEYYVILHTTDGFILNGCPAPEPARPDHSVMPADFDLEFGTPTHRVKVARLGTDLFLVDGGAEVAIRLMFISPGSLDACHHHAPYGL